MTKSWQDPGTLALCSQRGERGLPSSATDWKGPQSCALHGLNRTSPGLSAPISTGAAADGPRAPSEMLLIFRWAQTKDSQVKPTPGCQAEWQAWPQSITGTRGGWRGASPAPQMTLRAPHLLRPTQGSPTLLTDSPSPLRGPTSACLACTAPGEGGSLSWKAVGQCRGWQRVEARN